MTLIYNRRSYKANKFIQKRKKNYVYLYLQGKKRRPIWIVYIVALILAT